MRGYSPGGRVRWTWEDSTPSFPGVLGRHDGPAVSVGSETIAVVAPMLERGDRVGLRLVSLDRSSGVERGRVELDAPSAEPHAAWVDEDDSVWVAATTMEGSVMLHWGGAGGQPSVETSAGETLFRHAFFYPDGTLLALANAPGGGDDRLRLGRYSRSLQLQLEAVLGVDGFRSSDLWDMSVTFGCDETLLIASFWNEGSPVIAVDPAFERLWAVRGLGSAAVVDEHLILAGYDEEMETSAIWELRLP